MYTKCYYSKKSNNIITFPHPANAEMSLYGSTIDELKIEYPDIELMDTDQAMSTIEDTFKSPIEPSTEEWFTQSLEVLPPENWHGISGGQYFQMCEYQYGRITRYYIEHCGDYYTFCDTVWLTPAQVQAMLDKYLKIETIQ